MLLLWASFLMAPHSLSQILNSLLSLTACSLFPSVAFLPSLWLVITPDSLLPHDFTYHTSGEAWRAVIHGVAKSQTRLNDFYYYLWIGLTPSTISDLLRFIFRTRSMTLSMTFFQRLGYHTLRSGSVLHNLVITVIEFLSFWFFNVILKQFILFLTVLGLRCCVDFSLVTASTGYSLAVVQGLIVGAFRDAGFSSCGSWAQ